MDPWVAGLGYLMGSSGRREVDDGNEQQGESIGWPTYSPPSQPPRPAKDTSNLLGGSLVTCIQQCGFHVSIDQCKRHMWKWHEGKVSDFSRVVKKTGLKYIIISKMMESVEETVTILEHIGQVDKTICCITQKQRNSVPPGFCPRLTGGKMLSEALLNY